MKHHILTLFLVLAAVLFCQCTSRQYEEDFTPEYNEYVDAFTNGSILRRGEVRVVLSQDLTPGRIDSLKANDLIRLTPKAPGHASFVDSHTLVFVPDGELETDTRYQAEVDVPAIFGAGKKFVFSFKTRPFAISSTIKSFNVANDGTYEILFQLHSADNEPASKFESLIDASIAGNLSWQHSADGQNHLLTFKAKPTTDCQLTLTAKADHKGKSGSQEIISLDLPSTKTFSVVNVESKIGDVNTATLTLNKNIDPSQDIQGLVTAKDVETRCFVQGNKITLSGPFKEREKPYEIYIDENLRSQDKLSLLSNQRIQSVSFMIDKPNVRFLGDGTIIPQADRIIIPFSSIYMRGVRVSVYQIVSNNVGTLLQHGDINQYNQLGYAARPVAVTTCFIDEDNNDFSHWSTYALDLTNLFKIEPGAIYHVDLDIDARLSAWPCDSLPRATREEMAREDAAAMEKISQSFDEEFYYFSAGMAFSKDWWNYDYSQRQNPASESYYYSRAVGKNVLATNIGLSALRGNNGSLNVSAINLPDALPLNGVSIEAYNFQKQLCGNAHTNSEGVATLECNSRMGRPYYLVARKGSDVSYLKVNTENALSTSSFDVSGDIIERGLKGYIYGERGVWRPGDTLHLGFMLNDQFKTLPPSHPVTLTISNPLGQVTQRITRTTGAMGLYAFNVATPDDAPTGIWTAKVNVGGVTFQKYLRIESIKPNRLKIDFKTDDNVLSAGSNSAKLHTEWLNGNSAGSLRYDIAATVIATHTTFKKFDGYVFDDPTKTFETSELNLVKGETDASGNAKPEFNLNVKQSAPGMLKGSFVTHVYEPSGEFSVDAYQSLIAPYSRFVGIKSPLRPGDSHLDTDKDHTFEVASINKDGYVAANVNVRVDVYKTAWHWWWMNSSNNLAGFTSSSYNQPIKSFSLTTDSNGKADFKLNMRQANWGTYLIMVTDTEKGHSAGTLSYFDWPWMTSRQSESNADNATLLSITTDKKEYAPGETMHISLPSEEGSRAIVSLSNGSKVIHFRTYPCHKERTVIDIPVTDDMTPNVYVAASLVQPYTQTLNDMPIRLFGLIPITITSPRSHLHPQVSCPDEVMPETKCQVTVTEKDGRPMAYTLAIVDEGLLDLTRFKTPNAWDTFNAREALGVRFWDLYSHVNGAYGGHIEQLFSIGGDEALNNGPKAIVNRFRPMVWFAGPFTLKKGAKRTHTVNIPNYNGRVRAMVVATDGNAYGNAERSLLVRRPLMLLGTMPRQIGKNDEMTVSATVFATQPMSQVAVSIQAGNGLDVIGESTKTISFASAGDKTIQFRIKAGSLSDLGLVSLRATSGSLTADYSSEIAIRTISQTLHNTFSAAIEPGQSLKKSLTLPGDEAYGVAIEAATIKPLNLTGRLNELIAYPHGCAEQSTSRIFPQLYLADFVHLTDAEKSEVEGNVKNGISRLSSYVTPEGGIAYWPGQKVTNTWASAYVLYFLHEADAHGYYVPKDMKQRLTSYVSSKASAWNTSSDDHITTAFSLYVLAAMQQAPLGVMNRMREHAGELNATTISLLAASYAASGRTDIAGELVKQAGTSSDYAFWITPELARGIAHIALDDNHADDAAESIRSLLVADSWLSTSMTALSLVELSKFYKKHLPSTGIDFTCSLGGKQLADLTSASYTWTSKQTNTGKTTSLDITNRLKTRLYVTYTLEGKATQSHVEATSSGLALSVNYFSDDNQPLAVTSLPLSTTFKARVKVSNVSGRQQENIALTHIVPAGWEILSAEPSGTIHYQDLRDDRLLSYIDRLREGESVIVTLHLSATYSGHYYLPAIQAEAMYDAKVSGCTESGECDVK